MYSSVFSMNVKHAIDVFDNFCGNEITLKDAGVAELYIFTPAGIPSTGKPVPDLRISLAVPSPEQNMIVKLNKIKWWDMKVKVADSMM